MFLFHETLLIVCKNPAVAARMIKKTIYQGMNKDLDTALTLEVLSQTICASTGDV